MQAGALFRAPRCPRGCTRSCHISTVQSHLAEYRTVLDILSQLFETGVVIFLCISDAAERFGDLGEAFFVSNICERGIHLGPFFVLAAGGGFEIFHGCTLRYRVAQRFQSVLAGSSLSQPEELIEAFADVPFHCLLFLEKILRICLYPSPLICNRRIESIRDCACDLRRML